MGIVIERRWQFLRSVFKIRNSSTWLKPVASLRKNCVKVFGKVGFITGFTNGGAYIQDIEGNYITIPNKSYKQVSFKHIEFINHNNNW